MKYALTVACIGCVVLGFLFVKKDRDNDSNLLLRSLAHQEIEVLRDQIRDLESTLASKGSYQEGYTSALFQIEGAGGHYATGYKEGYHNAITQFGGVMPEGINDDGKKLSQR